MSVILDLLFPKKCLGCNKSGSYLCRDCLADILQTDLVCPICERVSIGGQTHSFCKKRYGLDGLWSLGIYQGTFKKIIQKLKYRWAKDLAQILADLVLEYWAKYQPFLFEIIKKDKGLGWAIIPVPLHWFRENKRGFNQSSLIGQILSKKLGLGYCDGLKRIRYTSSQVKLKEHQRRENIKDAFSVSIPYTLNPTPYILLIDDVWTTGSTLKECCYILKKAGAKQVWALTLAR